MVTSIIHHLVYFSLALTLASAGPGLTIPGAGAKSKPISEFKPGVKPKPIQETKQELSQTEDDGLLNDMGYLCETAIGYNPWDDQNLDSLLAANKKWAARMQVINPGIFEQNKKGHFPQLLWIGCSDARVAANEIFRTPPGSVFVHRNIANMVLNGDFNSNSIIQYAVDVLKVRHIIVCGHYDCGGVKASLTNLEFKSPLQSWLKNLRDIIRLHKVDINMDKI